MNNLNLGLAIGVSGLFLNLTAIYSKGGAKMLVQAQSCSSKPTYELNQQFKLYATCDDAVYGFSEFLPECSDEVLTN